METKVLEAIAGKIDFVLLGTFLISASFLFFGLKSRFIKRANLSRYAVFFYAFVFYTISSISYIGLNATANFFYRADHFFISTWGYFPYVLISSLFGALIGWIIQFSAQKVAPEYSYQLINITLVILVPMLMFVLLIDPYNQQIKDSGILPKSYEAGKEENRYQVVNSADFQEIDYKPQQEYFPAIPAEIHDSLNISVLGKMLSLENRASGFVTTFRLSGSGAQQVYVLDSHDKNYFIVLVVYSFLSKEAELMVINRSGERVFDKTYINYPNRMSLGADGRTILLQTSTNGEVFNFCHAVLLR
ncbi:MAG: hypothetical protein LCH37_06650 [Bacteroidetes bacterium]|nr:hypothetical protein [Bacteroidota bacterium]